SWDVLRQLRISWPSGGSSLTDTVSALKAALGRCPCAAACEQGLGIAEDVICKVHLKSFVEQQGLLGYDPNLDVLLVTEGTLRSLAELQEAVLQCPVSDPIALPAKGQSSCCSIVHVVNCEEEFQLQQLDVLWRILDLGAHTTLQKHLVCGPVKVTNPSSPIGADQYFHTLCMMAPALFTDEAWTEVIDTLTVAAIRFELLSTAHRGQITLDLENNSISTKGTKSGAFVMYNCARLATLFNAFQQAVEQGTYPPLPPVSELNFSCLREEGEWLLLFNYLLPFPEVLQQAAQLPPPSKGIRITANTETVSAMCYSIHGCCSSNPSPGQSSVPAGAAHLSICEQHRASTDRIDCNAPGAVPAVLGVGEDPRPAKIHCAMRMSLPCRCASS
uniref:DALR anticodon binding domain containing 3 n=1 Tax=Catharus ustulatus TaxID=91951 RepID=A0A8C3V6N8_CATUS